MIGNVDAMLPKNRLLEDITALEFGARKDLCECGPHEISIMQTITVHTL